MTIGKVGAAAALTALAVTITPAAAQDEAARVFHPSSTWTADFGDDYCRLLRTFSDGDETITLGFERIQPGPTMRLQIIGDEFRTFRSADRIGYSIEPSAAPPPFPPSSDFASARTGDGQRLTILSSFSLGPNPVFNRVFQGGEGAGEEEAEGPLPFPGYDPAVEQVRGAEVRRLIFDDGMAQPLQFEVGQMGDVMTVLQECTSDLLRSWGLDAERHASLQRGPLPEQGPLLGRSAVPFGQFSRLSGGSNQVRIMVSAEGAATSCHIHFPTLESNVNERICDQVLENARFAPAVDSEGEPLASYWLVPVFVLLGPPPG